MGELKDAIEKLVEGRPFFLALVVDVIRRDVDAISNMNGSAEAAPVLEALARQMHATPIVKGQHLEVTGPVYEEEPRPTSVGSDTPVHDWFGLTYARYLTLPRSILQSMPLEWQRKFVALLEEADLACETAGITTPKYSVRAVEGGRFVVDPFGEYRRTPNVFDAARGEVSP
jgi:hypothetical protein